MLRCAWILTERSGQENGNNRGHFLPDHCQTGLSSCYVLVSWTESTTLDGSPMELLSCTRYGCVC